MSRAKGTLADRLSYKASSASGLTPQICSLSEWLRFTSTPLRFEKNIQQSRESLKRRVHFVSKNPSVNTI
jgi:hypothetical protein